MGRKLATGPQIATDLADPVDVAQADVEELRLQAALRRHPPTRLGLAVVVVVSALSLAIRKPLALAYATALFAWWLWILVQYRRAQATVRAAGIDPARWMGPRLAPRWIRPAGIGAVTFGVVLIGTAGVNAFLDPAPGTQRGKWVAAGAVVVAVTDGRASLAVTSPDGLSTRSAILPADGRDVGDRLVVWIDPDDPLATEALGLDWFEPAVLGIGLVLAGVIVRRRRVVSDDGARSSDELHELLAAPGCLPSAETPLLLELLESFLRSGRADDAVAAARRAVDRSAGTPTAHLVLGRALREAGDLAAAKAEFERAWATRHDGVHFVASKELAATWAAAGSPDLADAFSAHAARLARRRGFRDCLTVSEPRRGGPQDAVPHLLRSDVDREVVGQVA